MDRFEISGYTKLTFRVEASLAVDRQHPAEEVKKQCVAALRDHFSLSQRKFAQDVTGSEVLACLQNVEGVIFARLDLLELDSSGMRSAERRVRQILRANPAVNRNGVIEPAQMLLLNPDDSAITLRILEMKA